MNTTKTSRELAIKLLNEQSVEIMGAPLNEFPDTPLTADLYDCFGQAIEKIGANKAERLKSIARIIINSKMEDIMSGNY